MSDQVLAVLVPAVTAVIVALIGAYVAVSGRGRDLAVLAALQAKDDEIRHLKDREEATPDVSRPHRPKPRRAP